MALIAKNLGNLVTKASGKLAEKGKNVFSQKAAELGNTFSGKLNFPSNIFGGSNTTASGQAQGNAGDSSGEPKRDPWILNAPGITNKEKKLIFNINPAEVTINPAVRGSVTSVRRGKVISRALANSGLGYHDWEIDFPMQTGNMLFPRDDAGLSAGQKAFAQVLEMVNQDVNAGVQELTIKTIIFKQLTLYGYLHLSSWSETAETPWQITYQLTFNVFSSSPRLDRYEDLIAAMRA